MTALTSSDAAPVPQASYTCHVLPAAGFSVVSGANLGDPLEAPENLCPGDVYRLAPEAAARRLAIAEDAPAPAGALHSAAAHRPEPARSGADRAGASPTAADPSGAGPSAAGPSAAGPSAAGPSATGPSAAGPSGGGGTEGGAVTGAARRGKAMKAPQGAAARNEAPGGAGAGAPPGALSADGAHRVAAGSQIGRPGAPLRQVARLTLLAPEGHRVDLALLALGEEIAALPLEPMEPGRDHTLVGVDPAPGPVRLADILSVGLARGTALALADGSQCPVEALAPGAVLLTRDHGPRPLRRMLRRTVRAVGTQAPVVIAAGTLDNAADLVLSQHQRLFRYERGPDRPTETAEILLRAGLMADGERIYLRPGGFVDYFVPVLDAHEILYAEGIPVESLEVNAGTLAALPEDLAGEIGAALPGAEQARHFGTEADETAAASLRARLAPPRRT